MRQSVDKQGRPVKFIRKGGKVIPIRVKRPVGRPKGSYGPKRMNPPRERSRLEKKAWQTAGTLGGIGLAGTGSFAGGRLYRKASETVAGKMRPGFTEKQLKQTMDSAKDFWMRTGGRKAGYRQGMPYQRYQSHKFAYLEHSGPLKAKRAKLRAAAASLRGYGKGLRWGAGVAGVALAGYSATKLFDQKRGRGRPRLGTPWWEQTPAGGVAAAVAAGAGVIAFGAGKSKLRPLMAIGREVGKYAGKKSAAGRKVQSLKQAIKSAAKSGIDKL